MKDSSAYCLKIEKTHIDPRGFKVIEPLLKLTLMNDETTLSYTMSTYELYRLITNWVKLNA